ncbi:MAG: PilZ domain-containing protein [Nitrospirae bacterium]|nr:PilZ domain-containing protein [Nitrospirota bacterium]
METQETTPPQETQTERRKALRAPLIVFKAGGGKERYFFGYAQTISVGGLFIASINPKKVGERFPIEFTLPGSGTRIECECEVVWRREYTPTGKMEPGFGVKFIDLPEGLQEAIETWIRANWQ